MTIKDSMKSLGKCIDEAYWDWLLEFGCFRKDGWIHWNAQRGYYDMKTGYFVPVGKPKWKKVKE